MNHLPFNFFWLKVKNVKLIMKHKHTSRAEKHTQHTPVGVKGWLGSSARVDSLIWMHPWGAVDSIREQVFLFSGQENVENQGQRTGIEGDGL